ncbi:sugar ABC transporter permease [Thermoanaerobacterium sp. CMT5567-10]|uniref:carbohydrate ABC transporter permease n=1 Tax=Thermoanaerobacterium sp. CMT5567-10 TaxID=3061989 RepID=UPI0026DF982D|nr:sugar ABC transporter permease [Thermoanaerobacterium sp. CMT5567-10]WKV08350.1 sugar ABC transporter permease [Thermoanaerobacterium sp. CMT5567-10]
MVKKAKFLKSGIWYWLFIAPTLLSLIIVVLIPFIIGIYYSFTDWNGINQPLFIGLKNFIMLKNDYAFWNSILFTAKFSIACIIIINIIGLGFAMLVTRKISGRNLMRTAFYLPNLIGGLILGFIWNFIFVDVFQSIANVTHIGWLNGWLSTTNTGFWGLVIVTSWQMIGYVMVIYIAYIESVPTELIEASKIDGANSWQQFKNVIFPLISPAFTISLFITLSNSFKLFDQNLSLTAGAPGNTTQMITLNIYQTAFSAQEMALGQAKAVVMFVIIAIISIVQVYFTQKREVEM